MSNEDFDKEAVQTIVTILKSNLQRSDVQNIDTELKHNLVLAKRKSKEQKSQKKKSKKKQCLTRTEKRRLGFYNIPRDSVKYEDILPMHHMWTEYMKQLLELDKPIPDTIKNWDLNFAQSVYKSDFHGSILTVSRSKCPSYVGKTGICIMDTKNTFKIVSEDNIVTTIPKKTSVFQVTLGNMRMTLFGKMMCIRPAERSTKKFKGHFHPDL